MKVTSLYLHIPFCLRKCNYCDFVSMPLAGREDRLAAYPGLLAQEFALYAAEVDLSELKTIYFGGGTPSLLSAAQVAEILALFPQAAEITLEANPETLDLEKLKGYAVAGVNRLSLGVQSFDAAALTAMGRCHTPGQSGEAIAIARQAGFTNINIDLIYGLPGQTLARWQDDVTQALALETEHISLYALTLEAGTPWGEARIRGELSAAEEDLSADMLEYAVAALASAGLQRYEIANFTRPGKESRHNCAYWLRENYLGLGPAAASCLNNYRFANTPDYTLYEKAVLAGECPLVETDTLSIDQVMAETIFLGLRLTSGVDLARFQAMFGCDAKQVFRKQIHRLTDKGLLEIVDAHLRLTARGLMLGNLAFQEFV